jgi:hypothetical protein
MAMFRVKITIVSIWVIAAVQPLLCQKVEVEWDKVNRVSVTTPTLQVVVNPPLRRGSPIHDRVYSDLQKLGADYVRYVPWLPYPKLGIAELEPPADGKTSWDFSLIDPMTIDFLNATRGHQVILNFSTIPAWMFKTAKPVTYPQDPDQATWDYTQGNELRDPTMKELGDYFARLVSWYTNGGFTDEFGKRHDSGHHFDIAYWEVLNEIDLERKPTPEQYVRWYDAIVSAIKKVSPTTKFVGLALAYTAGDPQMFEYFLNPKNHQPGIPLDMISYHFYAVPTPDQTPDIEQYTFFDQADRFIATVRYIEAIRQRLSPATRTTVDEIGSISAEDLSQGQPGHVEKPISNSYWHLSGATYAYVFGNLASLGIDVLGESQLVGYPTQFPSVSMVDWNTGAPNARLRILELLKSNFASGDKIVETKVDAKGSPDVYALGFVTKSGEHKLLLVNKRDRDINVTLSQPGKQVQFVNQVTMAAPPPTQPLSGEAVQLHGLEVSVVTLQ